jgi:predicted transcriptional regulator
VITSEQVKAARGLVRWDQTDLSAASGISLPAIKRLEQIHGPLAAQARTVDAIVAAFGKAGENPFAVSSVEVGEWAV